MANGRPAIRNFITMKPANSPQIYIVSTVMRLIGYIQHCYALKGSKVANGRPAIRNFITMKPANSPQIYIVILVMHNKIYVNVTIRKGITTPTLYLNHACTSFTHIHTLFIIVIVCCYSHKYTTQFSRFISKKFFLELLLQQAPV